MRLTSVLEGGSVEDLGELTKGTKVRIWGIEVVINDRCVGSLINFCTSVSYGKRQKTSQRSE